MKQQQLPLYPKKRNAMSSQAQIPDEKEKSQIVRYDEQDSESGDEDFTYEEDSVDELIDDITYQQIINPNGEWVVTNNEEDNVSSESDTDDCPVSESDFESLCSGDENEDDIGNEASTSAFWLGQLFSSKQEFKDVVNTYAVKIGRSIHFPRNDKERIYAHCKHRKKGCLWHINVSKLKNETSFWLKEMDLIHTCPRQSTVSNATSTFIAKKYAASFRCDPKKNARGFRRTVISELGVQVSRYQAIRAKNKALKLIQGDINDQYSKLWDYAEILREKNPGSTVILQLEDTLTGKTFKRMYVCLDALKRGFKAGCRPWIGVDGCHLKRPTPGILLTSVCMDPNNDPYPLAYAIVDVENKDSWEWFLQHLKDDLMTESEHTYTFMSDKQKGLILAFEKILPTVENRFCVRHLHGNMKRAGFKGEHFRKLLWKVANATTVSAFNSVMGEIEQDISHHFHLPLVRRKKAGLKRREDQEKKFKVTCRFCGYEGHNRVGCKKRKESEKVQQSDKQP
ncbi:hypothetical protein C2S52_005409 [Perilla frutescens var. hirtella]|nr:hypothetical protein C2S52_005409 [Perilla frutescens var. hirtella]